MSVREDKLHPLTIKLHYTKEYPYIDPSKQRAVDFYESEVDIDWTNCDRPQPNDIETFANNP
jgi:hypothetical protein